MSPQNLRISRPATGDAAGPGGRHRRSAGPGRHAAPRSTTDRPVTGSHRAPGTLPIESWLLMGKTRRQAMLASLVAVGLLIVALPAHQRQSGVDAVNAAAQRAVGISTPKKPQARNGTTVGGAERLPDRDQHTDEPAAEPSARSGVVSTWPSLLSW